MELHTAPTKRQTRAQLEANKSAVPVRIGLSGHLAQTRRGHEPAVAQGPVEHEVGALPVLGAEEAAVVGVAREAEAEQCHRVAEVVAAGAPRERCQRLLSELRELSELGELGERRQRCGPFCESIAKYITKDFNFVRLHYQLKQLVKNNGFSIGVFFFLLDLFCI